MLSAQAASWHHTLETDTASKMSRAAGQPQMTAVAPRDPGTLEESQELRYWHFVFYQRGKGDDVKLWGKDPSCICCRR